MSAASRRKGRAVPDRPGVTVEEMIARLGRMKGLKVNFDAQFQEIKDLVDPAGADFTKRRSQGERTSTEIYDSHAALYAEQGASVLELLLTPRFERWHRLAADNPDLMKIARVKDYFERAGDVLFSMRNAPRSRFASTAHEHWGQLIRYGNGCTYVRDVPTGGAAYRPIHVGAAWIDIDYDGNTDTVYWERKISAGAAVRQWKEKAPKCAQTAYSVDPSAEHTYVHAVFPNDAFDPSRAGPNHTPFLSFDFCVDQKCIVESGGFDEMPYLWSRYTVSAYETYGRGPGMLILPDMRTLQAQERTLLRSAQKIADPPLLAEDDGILGRQSDRQISLKSGAVIAGGMKDGKPLVAPLLTGGRPELTFEMIQARRELLRRAFHDDYYEILVQDRVEMTATEVLQRGKEKAQLLGPVTGRQHSEFLGPMIDRELRIAQRQGRLPKPPPELVEAKGEYRVEYESDATRMQRNGEVVAFSRTIETFAPMIEANPSLLEVFKQTDSIRHVYEVNGGRMSLTRTDEELAKIMEGLSQRAAEREVVEDLPGAAKGVRDLADARQKMRAVA